MTKAQILIVDHPAITIDGVAFEKLSDSHWRSTCGIHVYFVEFDDAWRASKLGEGIVTVSLVDSRHRYRRFKTPDSAMRAAVKEWGSK